MAAANAAPSGRRPAGSLTSDRLISSPHVRRQVAGQRLGLLAHLLERDGDGVVAVEGRVPGQALVADQAQGVDVAGRRGQPALGLLGREVLRGADDLAGLGQRDAAGRMGDAEVGDLHAAVGADQDVPGLDVAVHHAGRVRLTEPEGGLPQQRERGRGVQRALAGHAAPTAARPRRAPSPGRPASRRCRPGRSPRRSRRRRRCWGG